MRKIYIEIIKQNDGYEFYAMSGKREYKKLSNKCFHSLDDIKDYLIHAPLENEMIAEVILYDKGHRNHGTRWVEVFDMLKNLDRAI